MKFGLKQKHPSTTKPFVVSLSNHEQPFDRLRANGSVTNKKSSLNKSAGFTLLPVILTMMLIGAIAFLLNRDNGVNANMANAQMDQDRARYAAEAGLQAVNAKIQGIGCSGSYPIILLSPVTNSNFGGASYYAFGNKATSPPDTLYSTGSYNGTSVTLTRSNVIVYQSTPNTYILQPNAAAGMDSFISNKLTDQNLNFGLDNKLFLNPASIYPLLKFDLSAFPAGSLPLSAQLSLYNNSTSTGGPNAINLYRLADSWVEGNGSTGSGVSWITRDGTVAWTTAGGNYHPVSAASVADAALNTWSNFDITDLTSAWLLGRYANNGLLLAAGPLASNMKYASSDDSTATLRPKITFNYLLPCGTTGPSDATGATVTLSPTADSFNDSGAALANNGAAQTLKVYYNATRDNRMLFKFDTSSIPAGEIIQSATLRLYVSGVASGTTTANVKPIMANALDEAWDEGAGNNTNKACPNATVGTSWNYRTNCSNWAFIHPPNSAQAWTAMANLTLARSGHAAVAANNKIYVIGGSSSSGYLNLVQEYDPATNTWATKAPMPTARAHAAAAVVDGNIYVMGGTNTGSGSLSVNEVYDPVANTWASKAAMPAAKRFHAAAVVNDKIYTMGGVITTAAQKTTHEYDPATNAWTAKADMPTARLWLAAGTMNNKIYAMGGFSGGMMGGSLTKNEAYDPAANSWTTKMSLPVATDSMSSAVLGNKMFLISGYQGNFLTNAVWMYDALSDTFSSRAVYPAALDLASAAALNGKIYSMGGDNNTSYFSSHYRYDPGFPTPLATAAEESSGLSPLPAGFRSGWITLDLKSLVQEWVDGVRPNHGLVVYSNVADQFSVNSRENSSNKPQLIVTY